MWSEQVLFDILIIWCENTFTIRLCSVCCWNSGCSSITWGKHQEGYILKPDEPAVTDVFSVPALWSLTCSFHWVSTVSMLCSHGLTHTFKTRNTIIRQTEAVILRKGWVHGWRHLPFDGISIRPKPPPLWGLCPKEKRSNTFELRLVSKLHNWNNFMFHKDRRCKESEGFTVRMLPLSIGHSRCSSITLNTSYIKLLSGHYTSNSSSATLWNKNASISLSNSVLTLHLVALY